MLSCDVALTCKDCGLTEKEANRFWCWTVEFEPDFDLTWLKLRLVEIVVYVQFTLTEKG